MQENINQMDYATWQRTNKYDKKKFSILGDSLSTLEGYNPEGYNLFYQGDVLYQAHVHNMNDTWWGQLIGFFGGELLVNNSWSGSRVTKLPGADKLFPSAVSDERTNALHKGDVKPDVIFARVGSNDWGYDVDLSYSEYIDEVQTPSECVFDRAFNLMIEKLTRNYPNAEIWCFTIGKSYMSISPSFVFPGWHKGKDIEAYNTIIRQIVAMHPNCRLVDLNAYDVPYDTIDGSHPNYNGMCEMSNMLLRLIMPELEVFLDCPGGEHIFAEHNGYNVCRRCMKKIPLPVEEKKGFFSRLFLGR